MIRFLRLFLLFIFVSFMSTCTVITNYLQEIENKIKFEYEANKILTTYKTDLNFIERQIFINKVFYTSKKHNVSPYILLAQAKTENNFRNNKKGLAGELGIWQLMPSTTEWLCNRMGIKYYYGIEKDIEIAIDIYMFYMNELKRQFGTDELTQLAYNAGPGRVKNALVYFNNDLAKVKKDIYKHRKSYDQKNHENLVLICSL